MISRLKFKKIIANVTCVCFYNCLDVTVKMHGSVLFAIIARKLCYYIFMTHPITKLVIASVIQVILRTTLYYCTEYLPRVCFVPDKVNKSGDNMSVLVKC